MIGASKGSPLPIVGTSGSVKIDIYCDCDILSCVVARLRGLVTEIKQCLIECSYNS
jgi:hypothetical protein